MTAHRVLGDLFETFGGGGDGVIDDPGNAGTIYAKKDRAYVPIVTAGAETRTLADPDRAGIFLSLGMKTDGGTATITASSDIDQSGNNVISMDDVGDHILLQSVDDNGSYEWRVVVNNGCTLS